MGESMSTRNIVFVLALPIFLFIGVLLICSSVVAQEGLQETPDANPQPVAQNIPAEKSSPKTDGVVEKSPNAAPVKSLPARKKDEGTKLLRFPDIHDRQIVFCHGGDLWRVSLKGGMAVRLTAHEGLELFPKFSPDGRWIAFTGQYEGDEQVYVIPSTGGIPKRLTYYPAGGPFPPRRGYDHMVYGWTPDSKKVLFRSLRDANGVTELGKLYTVSLQGGLPEPLPMPTAGAGDFSPDGKKIVYSPLFRDFRTWKRYQGGWAQYLAIFDLETREMKRLDRNSRTEREPIWIGGKIYFTSDRTGTMNLFEYDVKTEKIAQCTDEREWDVRWASGDKTGKIVYELGGELVVYDTKAKEGAERFQKILIRVPSDGLASRPSRINVAKEIESYALAPGGKQAAVVARGDLFRVPVEKGFVRNLSRTSGAHERDPVWSKDGKTIACISDQSGEDQIYLLDPRGEKKPVQLTKTFKGQLDALFMSPCGRFLSVCDCRAKLYVVAINDAGNLKRGVPVEIVQAKNGGTPAGFWSACGGFLAYILYEPQGFGVLHVWETATGKSRRVSDPMFDVEEPVWDPAGNYLYYLSRREFAPQVSRVEWNFAGNRDTGIFALALRKDVPNLFGPQSDELPGADKKKTGDEEKGGSEKNDSAKKEDAVPKPIRIDWDGLAERVVRVPVSFDNYSCLEATEKYLVYIKSGPHFYGRESNMKPTLFYYDLKERKEWRINEENIGGYSLAPDGSRLLFKTGNILKVCDLKPESRTMTVKTGDLHVDRVPSEEWAEMFEETWRKFRDFFYVKNMHGYDWEALGRQYRQLLPHVAHRSDLNYVLGELVSELNVGHAYIQGGDYIQPDRAKIGLPGCRFELDRRANRYKIATIFRGMNEEPKYRSPLTEIGVDARVGDYVLAIDGIELTGEENPYRLLQHRSDPITLTLHTKPMFEGARKTTFVPVFNEQNLLYLDFVRKSMEKVEKATGGRAGYLHLPDMGSNGSYEFLKWYYPQIRKEGLVIDDRSNGGGNISQWIIMRLNQQLLGTRFGGPKESPGSYPGNARFGHQVCLINETSASDGDIFPYYFRKSGLGPLIGKRTWGGVVGISPRGQLLDGGLVFVPLQGTNDEKGDWIIEGEGVTPDIEVENDPKAMLEGKDPQLERGIAELLKRMDAEPKKWPSRPADPVKTK